MKHTTIIKIGIAILLLYYILLLCSCSHYKHVIKHKAEYQSLICDKDSVSNNHVSVIRLDTVIKIIPADTFIFQNVTVNCDSQNLAQLKELYLRTKDYNVWLSVLNGNLTANIERMKDSIEIVAMSNADTTVIYKREIREPKTIVHTPAIYKYALWGWVILLLILLGYLLVRYGIFKR